MLIQISTWNSELIFICKVLAAGYDCDSFRFMPSFCTVHTTIWSGWASGLDGLFLDRFWSRSAALSVLFKIQLGTCWFFVAFFLLKEQWMIEILSQAMSWSVTSSGEIQSLVNAFRPTDFRGWAFRIQHHLAHFWHLQQAKNQHLYGMTMHTSLPELPLLRVSQCIPAYLYCCNKKPWTL